MSVEVSTSTVIQRIYKDGQLVFTCASARKAAELAKFAKSHSFEECAAHARNTQVKAYGKPASRITPTRQARPSDDSLFSMARPSKALKADTEEVGLAAKALRHARKGKG